MATTSGVVISALPILPAVSMFGKELPISLTRTHLSQLKLTLQVFLSHLTWVFLLATGLSLLIRVLGMRCFLSLVQPVWLVPLGV